MASITSATCFFSVVIVMLSWWSLQPTLAKKKKMEMMWIPEMMHEPMHMPMMTMPKKCCKEKIVTVPIVKKIMVPVVKKVPVVRKVIIKVPVHHHHVIEKKKKPKPKKKSKTQKKMMKELYKHYKQMKKALKKEMKEKKKELKKEQEMEAEHADMEEWPEMEMEQSFPHMPADMGMGMGW